MGGRWSNIKVVRWRSKREERKNLLETAITLQKRGGLAFLTRGKTRLDPGWRHWLLGETRCRTGKDRWNLGAKDLQQGLREVLKYPEDKGMMLPIKRIWIK